MIDLYWSLISIHCAAVTIIVMGSTNVTHGIAAQHMAVEMTLFKNGKEH